MGGTNGHSEGRGKQSNFKVNFNLQREEFI